MNKKRHTN